MPRVRKVTGNYLEMLEKMFPNDPKSVKVFSKDAPELVHQLLLDLPRTPFFPTNGMTYNDNIATWMAPTVSKSFTQGNITASFFGLIFQSYLFGNPKFTSDLELCKMDNTILSFAYFDDSGVPCGVSISYSKLDPSLWSAAIIRNTVAEPKDREVLVIAPEEFLDLKEEGLTNGTDASHTFLEFLRSKALKDILKEGVFLSNGDVDIAKLNQINTEHPFIMPKKVTSKVEKLMDQAKALSAHGLDLNPQQFEIVKNRLEAKQKSKLKELQTRHDEAKSALHKPELDAALKQSFLSRHAASASAAALSAVILVGAVLALSGVLAPLGIALIGTVALVTSIVTAVVAGVGLLVSTMVMGFEEKALSDYQVELKTAPERLERLDASYQYQMNLQKAVASRKLENDPEQITRAVLAADFEGEEFAALQSDIAAAKAAEPAVDDPFGAEFGSEPVALPPDFAAAVAALKGVVAATPEVASAEFAVSRVDESVAPDDESVRRPPPLFIPDDGPDLVVDSENNTTTPR